MKQLMVLFVCLFLVGCIGHQNVTFSFQVKNKSNDNLYVNGNKKNTSFEVGKDTTYIIEPNTTKTIRTLKKYCWFGDCRIYIRLDEFLDTIVVFKNIEKLSLIHI